MTGSGDATEAPDHQQNVLDLIDDWTTHDRRGLAGLTEQQREAQIAARRSLYHYVDEMWAGAKRDGLDPANRPEWAAVAALRDLSIALAFLDDGVI